MLAGPSSVMRAPRPMRRRPAAAAAAGLAGETLPIIGRSPAMQEIFRVIARLTQTCFPAVRKEEFDARPQLDEKLKQFTEMLDANNVNGRYGVALADLRREYTEARRRLKLR